MSLGIIRVLTTEDDRILGEHGRMLRAQYGIASFTRCIPEQESGIFDAVSAAGMFAVEMLGAAVGSDIDIDGRRRALQ
ncbi:hypothetical protein [Robbsia sp. KACC 23696]|uniref:hypothetical protein n=1 Tax=Robbsia sp. KACC 23696 TaxID=3149231 RepID=UPI00325BEEAB